MTREIRAIQLSAPDVLPGEYRHVSKGKRDKTTIVRRGGVLCRTTRKVKRVNIGGTFYTNVSYSRTYESAMVPYADILAATTIEEESDIFGPPWLHCDGYEHDTETLDRSNIPDSGQFKATRGYVGYDRGDYTRVILRAKCTTFEHLRAQGASKQVAAEMAAKVRRAWLDQIVEWRRDGWQYYTVVCEYKTYSESCCGFDSEEYAERDGRREIANQVVSAMERDGYLITGKPTAEERRAEYLKGRLWSMRMRLYEQSWERPEKLDKP